MKKLLLAGMVALLVAGALSIGLVAYAQGPTPPPASAEGQGGPNDQSPTYTCSLKSGATPTITADQAKAAALTANPGTTATKVTLDDENSCLVYSVELSNGLDVKVDAGNGQILHTEAAGPEDSGGGEGLEGTEN
jgi:hypothetical protein